MSAEKKSTLVAPITLVRDKRYTGLRQEGLETRIDGALCHLQNISDTGLAFASEESFEVNRDATFVMRLSDEHKLELKGRILWSRREGALYIYGFHFNNQYLPEGFLAAFEHIGFLRKEIRDSVAQFHRILPEFKSLTYEIGSYLRYVKGKMDQLENQLLVQSEATKNSYREVIKSNFEKEFVDQLKFFSKKLDEVFSPLSDKTLRREHVLFFREQVGEYYTANPFIGRALRKPQGYAGDFEMMNQIYRDQFEGNTFFEILMHRYGIQESSSLSVKYRRGYFCDFLHQLGNNRENVRVGSMASGPAREVVEFLSQVSQKDSQKYKIVLMDQDVEALLNAKRNCFEQILKRDLRCEIQFLPISVRDILEQSEQTRQLREAGFDFIYTAGLYDYLTQPVAQMLTQNLLSWIRPGGDMIIGNFHPRNPTKAISELVADWKLIHRNEEEMIQLLAFSEVRSYQLHKDPEGIDLFLEIKK